MNTPPKDWSDKAEWDRYFNAEISAGPSSWSYPKFIIKRFLEHARTAGGRIWFPGCGVDPYPYIYAGEGCQVLATDFSQVAVNYQKQLADAFSKSSQSTGKGGTFSVEEHDFTVGKPQGVFDVVINCKAYQGLSVDALRLAAQNFRAALRPGGTCILDTVNVQGAGRTRLEDPLVEAGFYIPYLKTNHWYRQQLENTKIPHILIMGRPRFPAMDPSNLEHVHNQGILDSLQDEYGKRCEQESAEVESMVKNPVTIVAHIVYSTG